ncbi:hypothetical protein [Pyxidicoccus sp. MSG2]|uniref:hypothetical protein n=1 Tax=Pyxidicoccus sp. MSG2 TaxID=2996790 RepID=UPI00226E1C97|nr:hypothetical protein [Pyxidicoccus sp. MSG2]MCY1018402.1 hypothetical protein [Pyxidicoccus sp. MSG2]
MTRLIAFAVILSLSSTSTAWAQRSTAPTKKAQYSKKKPAKRTKAAPAPTPAPSAADEEQAAPTPMEAEPKPAQPAQDAPRQPQEPQTPPPSAGDSSSMDFDLLGGEESASAAKVDPELESKIARRRTMLKLHQGLGFALTASLLTTTVVGQLQFNDSFRGGGDDRNLLGLHRGLAIGTSAIFASVGLLGLLAPEPFEKKFQWDTITIHKLLMSVATVGMIAQVVLGIMATHHYGGLSERDYAMAHQVVGYTTLGAVSAGVVTLFF